MMRFKQGITSILLSFLFLMMIGMGSVALAAEVEVNLTTDANPIHGVAVDESDRIYYVDFSPNGTLYRMDANGQNKVALATGFNNSRDLTVDRNGNIYVADTDNHVIKKMDANGANMVTIGPEFFFVPGIEVDSSGNIYVIEYGQDYDYGVFIKRMDTNGENLTTLFSSSRNYKCPWGLAIDNDTNTIYIADRVRNLFYGAIHSMDTNGQNFETLYVSPRSQVWGITIDDGNNIYYADWELNRFDIDLNQKFNLTTYFSQACGIDTDSLGNLYIADSGNNLIGKYIFGDSVPVIASQPTDLTVNAGEAATLSVVPSADAGTLSYQWFVNSTDTTTGWTPVEGANASDLAAPTNIPGISYYFCLVTTIDNTGQQSANVISDSAMVTVRKNASTPVITTQPADLEVNEGDSVQPLSIIASVDVGTLSYQWFANNTDTNTGGTLIDGATSNTYTPPTNAFSKSYYYCEVTNTNNVAEGFKTRTVVSDAVSVVFAKQVVVNLVSDVNPIHGVAVDESDRIYYVDFSPNGTLYRMDANGQNKVALATGFNNSRDLTVDRNGNIYVADTDNHVIKKMDANGANMVTIGPEFFFVPGIEVDNSGNLYVIEYDNLNNCYIKRMDANGENITTIYQSIREHTNPWGLAIDNDANKIYVADRVNYLRYGIIFSIGTNGEDYTVIYNPHWGQVWGITIDANKKIFYTDWELNTLDTNDQKFNLTSYFDQACGIDTDSLGDIYVADSYKKILGRYIFSDPLPIIATQPADLTVNTGEAAPLSVVPSVDASTLNYQWFVSDTNENSGWTRIEGANASIYAAPTTTPGVAYYFCLVTTIDDTGQQSANVISDSAMVTVSESASLPVINVQPMDLVVNPGDPASLSIDASVDAGTLSYQWFASASDTNSGGTPIDGANSNTYTAPTTTPGVAFFYCEVTNTNTSVAGLQTRTIASEAAMVTVHRNAELPVITTQPTDFSGNVWETAPPLTVMASVDAGTLSYQWFVSDSDDNNGGTPIDGAIARTYDIPTIKPSVTYYYCVVTNTDTSADGFQTRSVVSDTAMTEIKTTPKFLIIESIERLKSHHQGNWINSIISKLENALAKIERSDYKAAVNQLDALIEEVNAQRDRKLTNEEADWYIAQANLIISMINPI